MYSSYQKESANQNAKYSRKPFYYMFAASNDPGYQNRDVDVVMDVNNQGNYKLIGNYVTPYDASNGLNSLGGFVYDSLEAIPLPKAVILNDSTQ